MTSLTSEKKRFVYGSFIYDYELIKQNRRTLSLTVAPDLHIYVKSPQAASDNRIELFLKRKWFWLEKQLTFFGKYQRKQYRKEYVSGESFHYLGRQYQLIVKRSSIVKVTLQRGILLVQTIIPSDMIHKKRLIDNWYAHQTERIFQERFDEMKKKFDYKIMPRIEIKNMKRRWGSFVNKDKIILNPNLIHVSKDCIDYVIIHELCHLQYRNHDKKYFKLLEEKYPKWAKTKEKLEIKGAFVR